MGKDIIPINNNTNIDLKDKIPCRHHIPITIAIVAAELEVIVINANAIEDTQKDQVHSHIANVFKLMSPIST